MGKAQGLVSIVVPVYNGEDYIVDSLESIVNQSYKNIELIIVDDGSTDESAKVVTNYLKTTNLNWRFYSQENKRQAAARNRGILEAKGEWIICPDSDDFINETMIERLLDVADSTGVECVFSNFKYVTKQSFRDGLTVDDETIVFSSYEMRGLFFDRSIRVAAPAALIKKDVFSKVKYDENCPYTEDTHFIWKLLYTVDKLAYVTGDYYNYLMRGSSTVHTLKPEIYLKASQVFTELSQILFEAYPKDYFSKRIAPRQRLGALRMLARCNDYDTFRGTVISDGYRRGMSSLVFCKYFKVSLHALLFCISIRVYYKIANFY